MLAPGLALTCLLLALPTISANNEKDAPVAFTECGPIRGYRRRSYANVSYDAYEGIPFARPPTGHRRFQPPEPAPAWIVPPLVADKVRGPCLGLRIDDGSVAGHEDCLYLNVYAPSEESRNGSLLPVIFWIYGGAFQAGLVTGHEQQYLMNDRNVVFVSTNYRHGLFGFLSTDDRVVTGNMGLKDQSLALRWVRDNIDRFGGDPRRISLAGASAGAASVHYHYLSPMSRGLFQAGLAVSGTALDPWATSTTSRAAAFALGQRVNCSRATTIDLISCFKQLPAHDLMKAQASLTSSSSKWFLAFVPVVERASDEPFIDRDPLEILRSGRAYDAPLITGIVQEEGLSFANALANSSMLQTIDQKWDSIMPRLFYLDRSYPQEQLAAVARKVRRYYFADKPLNMDNLRILSDMIGDRFFSFDAQRASTLHSRIYKKPVWFYRYTHRADRSSIGASMGPLQGTTHGNDVDLLLSLNNAGPIDPVKNERDKAMRRELARLWTAVAYYGSPSFGPRWQTVTNKNHQFNYLQIDGPGQYRMVTNNNLGNKRFWNSILK
ncbi:hypothetical protein TKK_0010433 [Trichogramma kaykai]|uniref:Carboxylic ester hydrolase n=1 Tax=Trichogramma kaykai TaxID=54128 RepID=A0ABD2WXV0_9HYME